MLKNTEEYIYCVNPFRCKSQTGKTIYSDRIRSIAYGDREVLTRKEMRKPSGLLEIFLILISVVVK